MQKSVALVPASQQLALFPVSAIPTFPSTRYQGSKAKLADWIWEQVATLSFQTCLDAFGGTGAMAYRFKQAGKRVSYNDYLRFNYLIGLALIENAGTRLEADEIEWLLEPHAEITYPRWIQETFADIYFTPEENAWLDRTLMNLQQWNRPYQFALAFFALCQSCLIKRPYNLFHRKNLYLRFAEVERSFGNKASWDRPFDEWFRVFAAEGNRAVFDNGQANQAFNLDAVAVPGHYDLVYCDPPYLSQRGVGVDYRGFYHFLEGMARYDEWATQIDWHSKHRRLKPTASEWTDKQRIYQAFARLFERYQQSILVVSYRSDGIPSEQELVDLLRRYKHKVQVQHFGQYQYALSTNAESKEILLIGQ